MHETQAAQALILITLIGGLVAYGLIPQYLSVDCLTVENVEARSSTDGVVVAVSFQNVGGKTITAASLEVDGVIIAEIANPIPPGSGGSFVSINPPGIWVSGTKKTGLIRLEYADRSSASTAITVTVTGSPSGSGQGNGQGWRRLLLNTFDDGDLNGWTLWGYAEAFAIEVDAHGKPRFSLHVYGNGPLGVKAGASKAVELPLGATSLSLSLAFDYNVHAPPDKKVFPGNLWLRVDAAGATLYEEEIYDGKSADSGWRDVKVYVRLPQTTTSHITLILYSVDQGDRVQEFWVDNVVLEASF